MGKVDARLASRWIPVLRFPNLSRGPCAHMSTDSLKSLSRKDLAELARKRGVGRYQSLSKPELIRALSRPAAKPKPRPVPRPKAVKAVKSGQELETAKPRSKHVGKNGTAPAKPRAEKAPPGRRNGSVNVINVAPVPRRRDLSAGGAGKSALGKNVILATASDPLWIRVSWLLSRDSVLRAETRLGTEWHRAVPVLRLFQVDSDDFSSGNEKFVKDVTIDSDSNTWYMPVPEAGRSFRVHVGYRGSKDTFFALAKSNICQMPRLKTARQPGVSPASPGPDGSVLITTDENANDSSLNRPLGFSTLAHFGPAATLQRLTGEFHFKLSTELVIHGNTRPGSALTVQGEPVELRDDGSFTLRVNQPEGRQVLAFTAMDPRGNERRMIVLGIERNTKELERQYFDGGHAEMSGE